jgi:hypothetical protein
MSKRRMRLSEIEAAINRWEARLFRAATALMKLRQQRKRIKDPAFMKRHAEFLTKHPRSADAAIKVMGVKIPLDNEPPLVALPVEPKDDLSVPTFLQRAKNPADEVAKAEILAAQAEHKKRKAVSSTAKRKAAAKGEMRKMPLSGKAALAYIEKA